MGRCKQKQNFMDEMHDIICEIERLKPEPEVCNVSCPPLGCPLGPCPGMCCSKRICDPCCVSKMPCNPSSLRPLRRCMPRCLKDYACSAARLSSCGSSSIDINRGNPTNRNGGCCKLIPHDQSG
ncbi:PREDICTED: keratin-associated protein 5-4-like, partial [Wasmannia auropunctata]